MAILVANIGTSDLSINHNGYFIPVWFDRHEPNTTPPPPDVPEAEIWRLIQRPFPQPPLIQLAQDYFGIKLEGGYFRKLTQHLHQEYQQHPGKWHNLIRLGRIAGVINTALAPPLDVHTIYIFVTNQPEQEGNGRDKDTIHLFNILQEWLFHEYPEKFTGEQPSVKIEPVYIDFRAIDQDRLLDFYGQFFQSLDPSESLLLSIKGGTPPMQNALRIQAMMADFEQQIFLEPQLVVADYLKGKPSQCIRNSFWRYQRRQKFQTTRLLLRRWDFEGAKVVLQDWKCRLEALLESEVGDSGLKPSLQRIDLVVGLLEVAIALLNLDTNAANKFGDSLVQKPLYQPSEMPIIEALEQLNVSQNLYAQCSIFRDLRQIANFLNRMGAFYEATQDKLIENLNGYNYLEKEGNSWFLKRDSDENKVDQKKLWKDFSKFHKETIKKQGWKKPHIKWNRERISSRYHKKNFIRALSYFQEITPKPQISLWQLLDFWYEQRNDLVHLSQGINETELVDLFQNRELPKYQTTCAYPKILSVMSKILEEINLKDNIPVSNSLLKEPYFIFTNIREWIEAELQADLDIIIELPTDPTS